MWPTSGRQSASIRGRLVAKSWAALCARRQIKFCHSRAGSVLKLNCCLREAAYSPWFISIMNDVGGDDDDAEQKHNGLLLISLQLDKEIRHSAIGDSAPEEPAFF